MYAIISDSGQQFRVQEGQEIELDYREAAQGDQLTFDKVLMLSSDAGSTVGKPHVDGASVVGTVLGVTQGPKLVVQHFRRRKNSRRKTGHRQMYTKVKIEKISN